MVLAFDTSRRPRRPSDWEALLNAIFDARPTDENSALEWKGPVNLRDKQEVARSVAREILALANRPVSVAKEHFDGYGVLVIGVEPNQVHDIAVLDSSELEPRLASYIGGADGPGWEMRYYKCQGKECLVITVEPPREGDGIYALRTNIPKTEPKFKTEYLAGTVFVRHQASSPMAKQEDLNALVARASTGATPRVRVNLDAHPEVANSWHVDSELVEMWLEGQRRSLLKSIEDDKDALARFNRSTPSSFTLLTRLVPDERSEDEFRAEVDRWIATLRNYTTGLPKTFGRALAVAPVFTAHNTSDHHLEALRVVLQVRGEVKVWRKADDFPDLRDELPPRPLPFGSRAESVMHPYVPNFHMPPAVDPVRPRLAHMHESKIEQHGDRVTITSVPRDLRANDSMKVVSGIVIFVPEDRDDIAVDWSADAKNLPGRPMGQMTFKRAEPIDVVGAFLQKFALRDRQQ